MCMKGHSFLQFQSLFVLRSSLYVDMYQVYKYTRCIRKSTMIPYNLCMQLHLCSSLAHAPIARLSKILPAIIYTHR